MNATEIDIKRKVELPSIEISSFGGFEMNHLDDTDGKKVMALHDASSVLNVNSRTEKLSYRWKDLDVFYEMPSSIPRRFLSSVKEMYSNEEHISRARKHLLKNVCGVADPGEVLAVLGSSGAGKTTLLNALAFRSSSNIHVSPSAMRMLNSYAMDAKAMQARCAYVQQNDLFIGNLKAREHLIFQAMLRMPSCLSYRQKLNRVDQVIHDLSLHKCQNTIIGIPGEIKGLSGGEKKRLALASEILIDPPLLICDEPTSGLDSFMADSIVQTLKNLSKKGKTVILTIHQPSPEVYKLFDKILLIAEGRVAFLGAPAEANHFFKYLGFQCPPHQNPADFYVQVLAIETHKERESYDRIAKICDNFATGRISQEMEQSFQVVTNVEVGLEITESQGRLNQTSWFLQLRAVYWRTSRCLINDLSALKHCLFETTILAFFVSVIFYNQSLSPDGVKNLNAAIYFSLVDICYQTVANTMILLTTELPVFMRESRNYLYRCDTYFLGKTLAEMPLFFIKPFIFITIVYPMIGLRLDFMHFLKALGLMTLVVNSAASLGYLLSCLSSSTSMALAMMSPVLLSLFAVGGFFINVDSVPFYLKWLTYLSFFRYGNEAFLINQWADLKTDNFDCTHLNVTCPIFGREILEEFKFSTNQMLYDCLHLVLMIFAFRLLACLCLVIKTKFHNL